MAFSGLYGVTRHCCHQPNTPVSKCSVASAALLDVVGSVAIAILIALGSKMGVNIPPTGQYLLGALAVMNMLLLLNRNIIPATTHIAPQNNH
ncbi:MAG: hypothetical protein S4CHLAM81_04720 [Chlamydiales bacterium]|nr:hypothetical protein [Chlamydiales bacterium]MCH9635261.1 hypothetical protein [Chlamydiales bacterium]